MRVGGTALGREETLPVPEALETFLKGMQGCGSRTQAGVPHTKEPRSSV